MVLVDSSIWIHLERTGLRLSDVSPNNRIAICPVVVMEVLRGLRDGRRFAVTREAFRFVELLDAPTPLERFEEAAQLYIRCRARGVTPSATDCLVAACAIAHGVPLLHDDADFEHMARLTSLKTLTP